MIHKQKTLKITLSALAFLVLSASSAYAFNGYGFQKTQKYRDLSAEQIEILEEARELRQSGEIQKSIELLEDAGLNIRKMHGRRFSGKMLDVHKEIRESIINDDYDSFLKAVEDVPIEVEITEEVFNKIVEAHSLRVEGKYEEAREIMEELGFNGGRLMSRLNRLR